MKWKGFQLLLIIVLIPILNGFGQDISPVDSLFYRGVTAYENRQYQDALELFRFLDRIYPNHNRITASLIMQGKSLYKAGDYQDALQVFQSILDLYPESRYADDAVYGLGTVYFRTKDYKRTVRQFLSIVEESRDKRLLRKAAKLSSDIMDNLLDEEDLADLLDEVEGEKSRAAVTLRLAQREIEREHFQRAKKILQDYIDHSPNSPFVLQMEQLLSKADRLGKGRVKIGVILPFTGPQADAGKELLEGIQYAVDNHNQDNAAKVELVIRDSKGKIIPAIHAAQEFCHEQEVVAIIGELQSDITAAIAGIVNEYEIPLLSPTATAAKLTTIGKSVFQLNTPLDVRGSLLADYAVSGLGLEKFAILAPGDEYGTTIRDAFVETVNRLGSEVILETWYFEGAEDLGQQFNAIREAGLRRMIKDSLIVLIPEEAWDDSLYAELMTDTLFTKQTLSELVDSTALAVTSIDGIFLPVYGEELPLVMSQHAYYNIKAQLFGGSYWHDLEALEKHKTYIDGIIFLSDFYVDPSHYIYYRFRDQYRRDKSKTPEKMEIYGYDTARFLLKVAGEKAISKEEVARQLENLHNFSGIRGSIQLNGDRVNTSIRFLQFKRGRIIRIK